MSNVDDRAPEGHPQLHGLLAEFDSVDPLMAACEQVRDAGYRKWDAHSPFPVHGLDGAMGVKPTKLPWIILAAGITGLSCALLLQWWTNAFDYPFRISGKPMFSLPAFIPVCFELTVLFSAFAAFFGSLALNQLPEHFNPIFKSARFRRATADRFFIYVESRDPAFSLQKLTDIFKSAHATAVEEIHFDERAPENRIPKGLAGITAVLTVLTLLPLAMIAKARESISELPRVHVVPDDMDSQYKFKAQSENWFFGDDSRAMRPPPEGTVAVENTRSDDVFFTGKEPSGGWTEKFPASVPLSDTTMQRGRDRFNIYCMPCHGLSGRGDGMVARRADALMEGTWVTPSTLQDERARKLEVGSIFNTISHGVRNMPAYGSQIEEADRWAIVMYVRALQLSQNAPKSDVPAEVLPALQ